MRVGRHPIILAIIEQVKDSYEGKGYDSVQGILDRVVYPAENANNLFPDKCYSCSIPPD